MRPAKTIRRRTQLFSLLAMGPIFSKDLLRILQKKSTGQVTYNGKTISKSIIKKGNLPSR